VQFQDALLAEQARYIHKTVPTAAFGGLIIVGIIVIVFRKVVPLEYLYIWLAAFIVLTTIRMIIWARYRRQEFDPTVARAWLRQAVGAAALSGALWGCGSLFMFPPGQLQYQFTFMFALEMMAVAAMFSYSSHFPTFLAFFIPSMPPGIIGLALQERGSSQQIGFAIGILLLSIVIIGSVRFFNRMILDTIRLRFENVGLVAQLTVQKDAAESANVAKTRFLAAASHDLRQPIHALNLYLGAFAQLALPRPATSLLGKVRQCVQIMDEMFRALLDVSKLDAGAIRAQIGVFPLGPLLARTRLEFEPQARAKGVDLRVVHSSAFVSSDPVLVERILRNLVSNAVRYTEKGRIVVGCRRHGATLQLCVYDTGLGIEEPEQTLIFEEFYQVGNRERDRGKGLGLGLAIVHRLARLLGSTITLRSRPGHGSLFAFDLPLAGHVELPALRVARMNGTTRRFAGALVVVVDDEELILDAAKTLLEQWDCTVIAATSGTAALTQLAASSRPPDVLICDYRLRGTETGVGVVEAVRNEFNADIPALLITGDTNPDQIRQITASGLAVLHKPLREEELNDALCALCTPTTALRN